MITDDELNQLLAPSRQIHVGPLQDPDPISANLATTGQLNPQFERQYAVQHGRYLSGFGGHSMTRAPEQVIERDEHSEIYDLESQDDVLGSGIFDPARRPATSNANVGVFASHYSLPGYHAREVPFVVNNDVTDLTADAQIVGVPSGGMAFVEARGTAQPYPQFGTRPPPLQLTPARMTNQYQPYAEMGLVQPAGQWDVDSLLAEGERQSMSQGQQGRPVGRPTLPGRRPVALLSQPPTSASATPSRLTRPQAHLQPAMPHQLTRGAAGMGDWPGPSHPARDPMWQVNQLPTYPQNAAVPGWPAQHHVPRQMTVTPTGAAVALGAFFEDNKAVIAWFGAGLVASVALQMYFSGGKKG